MCTNNLYLNVAEKGEELKREYTAKEKKEGTCGSVAQFMVVIAHGEWVIKCHHYNANINAETFVDFVKEHVPEMFKAGNNTFSVSTCEYLIYH